MISFADAPEDGTVLVFPHETISKKIAETETNANECLENPFILNILQHLPSYVKPASICV